MGTRGWLIVLAAVAAVLLLVGRTATALFVDHAWFEAMGAPTLFWEQVVDMALLQGGAWLSGSLFAFANLHAVRRTILAVAVPARVANLELTAMVPGRRLLSATIVVSLVVGAVLALPLTNWETLAMVRHGVPFGESEGIFDRDLGHYVYWLPFEETLYLWALVSVVALTAMVLVLYALTRSLRLEGRRIAASTHVRRHLSVLGALVLLLLAWSYRLDGFDLLLAGSGSDGLFLRVDHRVTLRMDYVLSFGSAIAALIILRTGWAGQLRAAFVTLTIVLAAAFGLRHAVPAVLARGETLGDPARRDADYLAARALYSRRAFDVDAVRPTGVHTTGERPTGDRAADGAVAPVPTPTATLASRASLWDAATLAEGLGRGPAAPSNATTRSSAARPGDADGDADRLVDVAGPGWRLENGRVMAMRVERPVASTGGWRVTLVDATQPVARDSVLDTPAREDVRAAGWPLVAPGLSGPRLLDARLAAEVPGALLATPLTRIAHAWALRDVALLGADSLVGSSLLVTHRDVRERVRRLAPVFEQGSVVHPVRDGDALYWALPLYSASDRYPFSQRWQVGDGVVSYFKHAATAVVDASTGRVRLVPAAHPDAIARTWMTRWPRLFVASATLPTALAAQLPPATDGAALQLRTFARYGSRLEGAVLRHLPDSAFVGGPTAPVMLSQGTLHVTSWSVPLIDDADRVAGVATVTGGPDGGTYWTAATALTVAWPTLRGALRTGVDRAFGIMLDTAISGGQPTTRPRLGRPEAIVTSRGLLFVQTVQGIRGDGTLVVRAVAVSDGRATAVGPTLADALASLGERVERPSGASIQAGSVTGPDDVEALRRWYEAMREAMRQGNWNAFGAAFDSLGRAVGRPPQ